VGQGVPGQADAQRPLSWHLLPAPHSASSVQPRVQVGHKPGPELQNDRNAQSLSREQAPGALQAPAHGRHCRPPPVSFVQV
jgi:hypothetical protein